MSRLAVDIVLFPSSPMAEKTIEANKELARRYGKKIVLNAENCFPHISLCMGVLEEKDIDVASQILTRIGGIASPQYLTAIDLSTHADSKGEMISSFEIKITEELQLLHEKIMNEAGPFLTYDVAKEMFFSPPPVDETTLHWVREYPEKSAFSNFRPHITAGFGNIRIKELPLRFTASKLALCHLGNHCTCRKVLASVVFSSHARTRRRHHSHL